MAAKKATTKTKTKPARSTPSGVTPAPASNERGRPTKFTPETRQKVLTALRSGNTYEAAAGFAGVSYDTLRNWIKQGQAEAEGEFFEFFEAVKKAEADAEAESVVRIRKAGQGQKVIASEEVVIGNDGTERVIKRKYQYAPPQWQADAWFLERRRPTEWGRKDRVQVENDPIDWSLVPDDILDAYTDGKITEADVRRAIVAGTRQGRA